MGEESMFRHPGSADLRQAAARLGMKPDNAYLDAAGRILRELSNAYEHLDTLADTPPKPRYPRNGYTRPTPEENPHGAWYVKTSIKGTASGPLAGRRVALKDNICLAGVPMMNGATVLEGFVPDIDATVVTRILDAGGTIVGKAANTYLCFDGGSATTATGMVENPRKPGYSSGGSSAGSAVVIVTGEADMALGCDQGGSIRMPSAWSGIVGHKPTHGLVPYTGVFPIEATLDHCGPMAASVRDAAALLQVIAGPDGLDPRQIGTKTQNYVAALDKGVKGMKIGLVKEGFGHAESERVVDVKVKATADVFKKLGAEVKQISVPWHLHGLDIWTPIATEGATAQMLKGNGMGWNWEGYYNTSLLDAYARGWRTRPNDLSETVKLVMMTGEFMHKNYHGRFYAKAQNLSRRLREAYDAALGEVDVMIMPTIPFRATKLPAPNCSREDYIDAALNMLRNTAPFDASGHPACTIPCGVSDDLPIGLMIIGKRYDDASVLQAANAYEGATEWEKL
jgi:amidase